jgi:hypothetical protein
MRREVIIIAAIALCPYAPTTVAQAAGILGVTGAGIDRAAIYTAADTTVNTAGGGERGADTANADGGEKTAVDVAALDDEELMRMTLAVDSVKTADNTQRLGLIRRGYEYKRQTRAAIMMMIFIAAAMATSQSWNPK